MFVPPGLLVENDLLHPASRVAVDVLSLSSEQVAAINAWLRADITQKQLMIDCAKLLSLRGSAPISSLTRSCPS